MNKGLFWQRGIFSHETGKNHIEQFDKKVWSGNWTLNDKLDKNLAQTMVHKLDGSEKNTHMTGIFF